MVSVAGQMPARQAGRPGWVPCANGCGTYIDLPGICQACEERYALQGVVRRTRVVLLPLSGASDPLYIQVLSELQDMGLIARWDIVDVHRVSENLRRPVGTVRNALNQLYTKGWIEKRRHGIQNEYRVVCNHSN